MAKAKKTSKKKTAVKSAAIAFPVGSRVQVKAGDYGNARGTVSEWGPKSCDVLLDAEVHTMESHAFQHDELIALP